MPDGKPLGEPHQAVKALYSDLAIELVLILRLVFHLGLRQAEGFTGSVLRLLGLDLPVPDNSTLSRRSRGFSIATGYGRRSLVVTAIGRYKALIGPRLRARTFANQQSEVALGVGVLNRMIRVAKPISVRITG